MFKYILILFNFIYLLNAFPIRGNVIDSHRAPVSFAIIQNISTGQWEIGDEFGQFTIDADDKDSLIVQRYGYEQSGVVVEKYEYITIVMDIDPITVDPVVINENRLLNQPFSRQYDFEKQSNGSIASNLIQVPGIQIRSYGGLAGNATVSIDGGSGSHTKIIYEGIDLTNPQNGETDISQLPNVVIGSASTTIHPGLFYGSGISDGVIYLNNAGKQTSFKTSFGNWGRRSWTAQKKSRFSTVNTYVSVGQLKAEDDYEVTWQGKTFVRKNNHFQKDYSTMSASGLIHPRVHMKGSFLYSRQGRGVAGFVFSPSLNASRKDDLMLLSISGAYLLPNGFLMGKVTTRNSDENYIDPDYAIDSRHTVFSNQYHTSARLNVTPSISINIQGEYFKEGITSTDTDRQLRHNMSGVLAGRWKQNDFSFQQAVRFDKIGDTYSGMTYHTDMTWQQSSLLKHILSFGTSFRTPSFNDMYWIPGGNKKLQPEEAFKVMSIHSWQSEKSIIDLTVRNIKSANLIQWIPGDQSWHAENIASTNRTSMTISTKLSLSYLDITGYITRLWSQDNIRKNSLRYAPNYGGFVSITKNFHHLSFTLASNYTGEQIAMYDFPKDITLSSYLIASTFISYRQSIAKQIIQVTFSVENIFDKQYQSVFGYPEPGRAFNLSFNIQSKEQK